MIITKPENSSHPRSSSGTTLGSVTDGYQVYHTIEKEREDLLRIIWCWVHARRKFDEALNVIPKAHQNKSDAFLVIKQIQAIYREEGELNTLSSKTYAATTSYKTVS